MDEIEIWILIWIEDNLGLIWFDWHRNIIYLDRIELRCLSTDWKRFSSSLKEILTLNA